MSLFPSLDVSQQAIAICLTGVSGARASHGYSDTGPDANAQALYWQFSEALLGGIETGAMTLWLARGVSDPSLDIVCCDTQHRRAMLRVETNKAAGKNVGELAHIMRARAYRAGHANSFPPVRRAPRGRSLLGGEKKAACA